MRDRRELLTVTGLGPHGRRSRAFILALGLILSGAGLALTVWRFPLPAMVSTPSGWEKTRAHSDKVYALSFSPDGKVMASGSASGIVKLWDITTGLQRAAFVGHPSSIIEAIAFSPDGQTLATSENTGHPVQQWTVRQWDVNTGKQRTAFPIPHEAGPFMSISAAPLIYSADGKTLAAGVRQHNGDQQLPEELVLWDSAAGDRLRSFTIRAANSPILWMADGETLVVTGRTEERKPAVYLLASSTGKQRSVLQREGAGGINTLAISDEGKTLASIDVKSDLVGRSRLHYYTITRWDLATSRPVAVIPLEEQTVMVTHFVFPPDLRSLVSRSVDGSIRLWDASNGKQRALLRGPSAEVTSLACSPNGKTIAWGDKDGTIEVCDLAKALKEKAADPAKEER